MEYPNCLIKFGLGLLRFITVYRPPPNLTSPNVPIFLSEFVDLLEELTFTFGQLLLIGDLNVHVYNPTSAQTKPIIDPNHRQSVVQATHQKGHIINVIITRRDELPIVDITCDESVNSDHSAVIFTVPTTSTVQPKRTMTVRSLKHKLFENPSRHCLLCSDCSTSLGVGSRGIFVFLCCQCETSLHLPESAPQQ